MPTYVNDTKVIFHYQTRQCNDDGTVIDDSRKHTGPMELIIGKQFKYEVWEHCLQTMHVGEVASFIVDKSLTSAYPIVSKSLRDIFLPHKHGDHGDHGHHHQAGGHCCAMLAMSKDGLGHADLDSLMAEPQPLEFILEVLRIELPGEYERETWTMAEDEKRAVLPTLREDGNALYKQGLHKEAAEKYASALGVLEGLMLRYRPGDEEYIDLERSKVPLLLNFAQCKYQLQDYYPVIEHTTEVLKKDPDNVKAYYRRAKAHEKVWNVDEAKADLQRAAELEPALADAVAKDLRAIDEAVKRKRKEEGDKLRGRLFTS